MQISWILLLLAHQKYWILFILFLIEGPIVNFIASMLSINNIFNIWLVMSLAITGNIVGDIIHYFVGYFIPEIRFKKRIKHYEKNKKFNRIEKLLNKHTYKSIFLIKLIPAFSSIGLLYIGNKKISFKKFMIASVSFSILLGLIISFIGYYVIGSLASFLHYFGIYRQIAMIIAIIIVLAFVIFYLRDKMRKKMDKIIFNGEKQ